MTKDKGIYGINNKMVLFKLPTKVCASDTECFEKTNKIKVHRKKNEHELCANSVHLNLIYNRLFSQQNCRHGGIYDTVNHSLLGLCIRFIEKKKTYNTFHSLK